MNGAMLPDHEKSAVSKRLRRIEGQVAGVHRMVEGDTYCIDVLNQIAAVQGALGQVARVLLAHHVDSCVRDAFERGDKEKHDQVVAELLDVFSRYARLGPSRSR